MYVDESGAMVPRNAGAQGTAGTDAADSGEDESSERVWSFWSLGLERGGALPAASCAREDGVTNEEPVGEQGVRFLAAVGVNAGEESDPAECESDHARRFRPYGRIGGGAGEI